MADICSLEPFLYDSQPVDPVQQATSDYYGGETKGLFSSMFGSGVVSQPQASSSSSRINEQKLENYMNRLREALCTDLTAIEARLDALEAT